MMNSAPTVSEGNANTSKQQQGPRPEELLLQMTLGIMATASLSCVVELEIAERLKNGPRNVAQLATEAGVKEEPLYRVLRALASGGIFAENTQRVFALTPGAELLCKGSKGSLHDFVRFLTTRQHFEIFAELMHGVKTGDTVVEKVYGVPCFEYFEKNAAFGTKFNDAMTEFSAAVIPAALEAYDFGWLNGKTLVDIAGGHGKVLTEVLVKYPEIRGKLFDLEHVVNGAKPRIESLGIAARCGVCHGDFFQAVPEGDAYIMKHIIHDWDDAKATTILKNIHKASPADARVVLLESVIAAGNAPHFGKWLDLEMLLFPGGCERTEEGFRALFAGAGFRVTRIVETKSPLCVIEAVKAS
jgi:hypothetical protein